jgi:hypothetical protein
VEGGGGGQPAKARSVGSGTVVVVLGAVVVGRGWNAAGRVSGLGPALMSELDARHAPAARTDVSTRTAVVTPMADAARNRSFGRPNRSTLTETSVPPTHLTARHCPLAPGSRCLLW